MKAATSIGPASFDSAEQTVNIWLKDLATRLGWRGNRRRAYLALRAVLHALRDRLTVEEAADLGAQLPMLVRGAYYEGWRPAHVPLKERKPEQFLAHVAAAMPGGADADPERVARAVFALLEARVTGGEIADVKATLPAGLRALWMPEPRAARRTVAGDGAASAGPGGEHVRVRLHRVTLEADVTVPAAADGVVVFIHGSGSGRHNPRDLAVAVDMQKAGLATALVDLLSPAEQATDVQTGRMRFDLGLMADRVAAVTEWVTRQPALGGLPVGYFAAGRGAAAAVLAAARPIPEVRAIVCRSGHLGLVPPDALSRVTCPVRLIVGGEDPSVVAESVAAMERLGCDKRLELIPGATHLFEEPGAIEHVAALATAWFRKHLRPAESPAA